MGHKARHAITGLHEQHCKDYGTVKNAHAAIACAHMSSLEQEAYPQSAPWQCRPGAGRAQCRQLWAATAPPSALRTCAPPVMQTA